MILMGIDPGTHNSALVVAHDYEPLYSDKIANSLMLERITDVTKAWPGASLLIERPVCHRYSGAEVSDTAIWTGIFMGSWEDLDGTIQYNRQKIRMHCVGKTASDSKIRDALIERFDPDHFESVKFKKGSHKGLHKFYLDRGSKWFKGFTSDIWQAYAIIVTHLDIMRGKTWQQMMEK